MKVKHLLRTTLIAATMLLWSGVGWGQINIASWSFDALTAAPGTSNVIAADYGEQSGTAYVYLDGTNGSSLWTSEATSPELTTFGGSTLNDPRPTVNAGNALAIANNSANGKAIVFKLSTTGYENIAVSFATRGTGTGFNSHAWSWSTDNVTYTPFWDNTVNNSSTWTVRSTDLSSVTDLNDQATVYLKLVVDGATAAAGNNRIDNFVFVGTELAGPDTAPPVPTFFPESGATDVAVDVNPTITFDEAIYTSPAGVLVDNSNVESILTFTAGSDPVDFSATITGNVITVVPDAELLNSQSYTLTVAAVEDELGNAMDAPASATFTTIAASTPVITLTSTHADEIYYGGEDITVTWTSANVTTVDLEVWIPSESTWMAVESGLPAAAGTVTTTPDADTDFATTYKLRLKDVDSETYSAESGEFTIRPVAADLATVRGYAAGTEFRFDGSAIVSYSRPSTGRNQKYIQDDNSGILIDDNTGIITEDYPIGSEITGLVGKISIYSAMVQVLPLEDPGVPTSLGNDVIPFVTDLGSLTSADQGKLIKLSNIVFTSTGIFESGKNYNIKDEAEVTSVFRTAFAEADYIGEDIPALNIAEMLALVGEYNGTIQLTSRSVNDWLILSDDATLQTFTLGGLNVLDRAGLLVDDPDTDEGATLYVDDFTDFKGIAIAATDDAASVEVYLNTVLVDEADYADQVLADGDVVVAVVTAEDGTIAYYKVTITGENRVLEITGPALPATYNTGDDIEFTWTATNIDYVDIYVVETEVGGEAFLLNEDAPVDATLGTFTYTVVNGDFGTFTVRIEDADDNTFFAETTEVLTVVDNIHPEGVEFYPEMGDVDVPVSFTLSIQFDEDIEAGTGNITINKVSDDSEVLSFTETDFNISYDVLTIDVSGLAFETEYYILADAGVIKDLSGNGTPALDDKTEWTFTTVGEPVLDVLISEYVEGSSNNRAIELYNPNSVPIDLSNFVIKQSYNGEGWGIREGTEMQEYILPLSGMLGAGDTYVIYNNDAEAAIAAVGNLALSYGTGCDGCRLTAFTGNDAIGLFKVEGEDLTLIDVVGVELESTAWDVAGTSAATQDYTLVRKSNVIKGNTNWAASAGTNADDSEWLVYPLNTFDYLGSHDLDDYYNVTLTVVDAIGSIAGAAVVFDGENFTTNVDGVVTIDYVFNGTYEYSVTMAGYNDATGNIVVQDADVEETIIIIETGIVDELFSDLKIYPNPFSQTLWIDNVQNARSVVVVNLIGQQVMNMQLHGDSRVSIPTENLPSGVYLISVEGQGGERTVRRVIKR